MVVKYLYLILSIMLLACLLPMPYGYYVLVRFVAMAAFAWMAYDAYSRNKKQLTYVFTVLALLFQPFAKIALGRTVWNIVDVLIAVFLMYLLFASKEREE